MEMGVCCGVTKVEMLFLRSIRNWIILSCLLSAAPVLASARGAATEQVAATATAMPATRDTIPRPIGYINDFEHLFTPGQIDTLDNLLHDYEQRTTIEIAVLTADSSLTMYGNFDFFTLKTMSAW